MIIMSLRGAVAATKQSPVSRGDCFATCARNDILTRLASHKGMISLRELQSATGAPKGVLREGIAPAFWDLSGVDAVPKGDAIRATTIGRGV